MRKWIADPHRRPLRFGIGWRHDVKQLTCLTQRRALAAMQLKRTVHVHQIERPLPLLGLRQHRPAQATFVQAPAHTFTSG
ncbi:hypothetical protein D1872_319010 [compost metagenome]